MDVAALLEQMWSSVIHVRSFIWARCVPMQKKDKKEAQKCFIAAVEQADFPAMTRNVTAIAANVASAGELALIPREHYIEAAHYRRVEQYA